MKSLTKNKKPGEHYLRYLLSYMMILLIPLTILTFFYSSRFMKKFYEEIYETVDLELVQISTQLDNELESMQNIVNQLVLADVIYRAAQNPAPLELRSTITSLSGFASSNPFLEDIVLILDNNDYILTSSTTCKKDLFFRSFFYSSTMTSEEFLKTLENSTIPMSISEQKLLGRPGSSEPEDAILFSYPLYSDYQKREGTAVFYVKNSSFQKLLNKKLQTYQAQLYIINPSGRIVTTFGPDDVMRPFLSDHHDRLLTSLNTATISREDYVVRTYQSDATGWSYAAFIPDKQTTFSQVTDIMREFLLAIVLILLIASFTIFLLQKVNYAPMRRLRDKARQISPNGTSRDELATISNALDYLSEQNSSLSSRLEGSLTAVKNERLYRLLGGEYADRGDFNLDCSELDLSLESNYFHVGIVLLHTSVPDLDILAQELKRDLDIPYLYYYLHYLHPNQIVLLFNLPDRDHGVSALYHNVQTYLSKQHGISVTIGMGSMADSTQRIAQSYMEAASALDYRFVKGNGTLIEFREVLGPERANVVYPNQEFETLRNSLLSRNEQSIRSAIQNIIRFMEQSQLPLYLARSICFDLIHLVNEQVKNRKDAASNSPLELSGMETAQEIIGMLQSWSERLTGFHTSPARQAALEDILRFLDDNCLRCDFSVYEAALHFDMTLPAFSKYFKDSFGQNVMDYTLHMRMEKAKVLMDTTKLPLKDIAEQVGYYNISSFNRRFKLSQGITPGDYRKIAQKKV